MAATPPRGALGSNQYRTRTGPGAPVNVRSSAQFVAVRDIVWDTDGSDEPIPDDLPTEGVVLIDLDDLDDDVVADALTDWQAWCVSAYTLVGPAVDPSDPSWQDHGFGSADAAAWATTGLPPAGAAQWRDRKINAGEAHRLSALGFTTGDVDASGVDAVRVAASFKAAER